MIINPFINDKKSIQNLSNTKKDKNKIIEELQKYVIDKHIDYLKQELREPLYQKLEEYICTNYLITSESEIDSMIQSLMSKIFGYDILQKYINDYTVSDIRAVRFDLIYIKKHGKWSKAKDKFESKENFENYIRYVILKNGSNINFESPIIVVSDKKYNLRIEAGISPVNVMSSSLVIRIHRISRETTLETLFLEDEMLDSKSYKLIIDIVNNEKNVILSGKGGSGKTTLLREIINKIPDEKSITICEETAELYIDNRNVVEREILENREENKKITLEKLLKHSLVMSNDVIVVGELKGSETSVFLDAISTGHIGMGTVHSDSVQNTIDRLVTLTKRDIRYSEYKEDFIKKLLASSIDYLVYIQNYKVCQIAKVGCSTDGIINLEILYDRGDNNFYEK